MDEIDEFIIKSLKKNSRMPYLQIAKKLKLSEGTIRKRVVKLVEDNVIASFTINTSTKPTSIVGIETETHTKTEDVVKKLKEIGFDKIYEVTGRYDIICVIDAKDVDKTNEILEKMRLINGVEHTETFMILKKTT